MNTLADSLTLYTPAIGITKYVSRSTLTTIRALSFGVLVVSLVGAGISYQWLDGEHLTTLLGIASLSAAVWIDQFLAYTYHNTWYFRGLNSLVGISETQSAGATYDVVELALENPHDLSEAFCTSQWGQQILFRAGISQNAIQTFLSAPRHPISAAQVVLPEHEMFSIIGLGKFLLKHDSAFAQLFATHGVLDSTFLGSLRWVIGAYHQEKRRARWWSKDNLSQITGIGREWTYGTAYTLQKFSRDIRTSAVFSTISADNTYGAEKVHEIETALVRAAAANVLIVGEAGVGKIDLVMQIKRAIQTGTSLVSLSGKEIIVLDTNRLFATHSDKHSLEQTLQWMFDEAAQAGNIIIVIENVSQFINEAHTLGVYIPELLDEYLAFPQIQIIATDTPAAYHQILEPLGGFARRFVEVLIESPDQEATTRLLQPIAQQLETRLEVLFTFAALQAATTAANQYITQGVMPDKAVQLLTDIASQAHSSHTAIITDDFVYKTVSQLTGIPAGPIQAGERDTLLHLEDKLHQAVVGQEAALQAIARTMRRARAGIQSGEKPIGSFLFLGPTGVGKTETAKALAKEFFNGEEKLQRLDMSEYSGEDAVQKLIGDGSRAGVLPTVLREHPYCVLLLDEFEKATQSVHDIFLQILDEGIFTSTSGMKINARNCIIIATSNAGSQLILRTVEQRKSLQTLEGEIIGSIIKAGIYRPELLNRFDSVIIFEPLTPGQQTEVAQLLLAELSDRVAQRGYTLRVTPPLLQRLSEKGYSAEFGAREMKRVLQDILEEKIAQKIISDRPSKGSVISLTPTDFTDAELAV